MRLFGISGVERGTSSAKLFFLAGDSAGAAAAMAEAFGYRVDRCEELIGVTLRGSGTYDLPAVGEFAYQPALQKLAGGLSKRSVRLKRSAVLVFEDDNRFDDLAVRIDVGPLTVGYLSRSNARELREMLAAQNLSGLPALCEILITGGRDTHQKEAREFKVMVDLG